MASSAMVGDEIVAGLHDPGKNLRRVAEEVRRPLVALAAHEAIEVVEPHADRPLVEGTGDIDPITGRIVVLAKPRCGIAVLPQDRADGRVLRPDDGVIAGIAGGLLGHYTKACRVMVAAGDQRRTRG